MEISVIDFEPPVSSFLDQSAGYARIVCGERTLLHMPTVTLRHLSKLYADQRVAICGKLYREELQHMREHGICSACGDTLAVVEEYES